MKNNICKREIVPLLFCLLLLFGGETGLLKCGVRVRIKLDRSFFCEHLVARCHLVCHYLCYILIRQICRLEKQFVKFINIRVGLVCQVVLYFFTTSDRRGWILGCGGTKVAEKSRPDSYNANENLKYFIIPLVVTQYVRDQERWVRAEMR